MGLAIKILRGEDLEGLIDGFVFEQNRAEHRLLGLDILRGNSHQDIVVLRRHHILQHHNVRARVFHFGAIPKARGPIFVPRRRALTEMRIWRFIPNLSTGAIRYGKPE